MIEEVHRQSEARVKEEVDASLGEKMGEIEKVRADLLDLEEQLQKTKEFFVEANMKAIEDLKQEQEDKEKEKEETQKEVQTNVTEKMTAINGDIESIHKKVASLGKEKDKLKTELDKTVKVSFTTINDMKADLTAENRVEVENLKKEVEESIKENENKVVEAEAHVKNLRELNSKLLEQVKAQMADHGQAQEVMVTGLRSSNQQFLVSFQQEVEQELQRVAGEVEVNAESVRRNGEELSQAVSQLGSLSQAAGKLEVQVEGLEVREQAVEMQAGKMMEDAKAKADVIAELTETIASLDGRHLETVERIREVALLVSQFESQTKEIGQAFKEDQRKELSSIETQLNTIYAEYEKIEKEMGELRQEKGKFDVKASIEELTEKQQVLEKLGSVHTEGLSRTEDKIGKIMETAGTLMVSDVTKTEKIAGLEKALHGLEDKFSTLESADLFLQESQKQLVERTTLVESQGKRLEEELTSQVEEQQKEVEEKLKVQVAALLKDVGVLSTDQETLGEQVEQLQEEAKLGRQKGQQLEKIEVELPAMRAKLDGMTEIEKQIQGLEEETRSLAGGLVSLQFQAEKEEAVMTLASRVDRIDMVGME